MESASGQWLWVAIAIGAVLVVVLVVFVSLVVCFCLVRSPHRKSSSRFQLRSSSRFQLPSDDGAGKPNTANANANANAHGAQPTHGDDHHRVLEMDHLEEARPGSGSDQELVGLGPNPCPCPCLDQSLAPSSQLDLGHSWFTLRDLELATDSFSPHNVLGQGGYGVVYRGKLSSSSSSCDIAVKKLLNNFRGQAEKEFRVEVDAIGKVRHKNLVRLIGFCVEGAHRMLVYEYVDNGNLEQWLHGKDGQRNSVSIPWAGRMKIALGTAKGLAYLHEGLEPKVVHRDLKSSNILLDTQWNPKISDFGLAKLLCADKSFVTTRVMGTFGYVAPEYANSGLLNERSDVYSFGVLLMEIITGRHPIGRNESHGPEVNLVDWLKMMVARRRLEEVLDSRLDIKPSSRALKRALLVALRCVNPDAQKRPKIGHVVQILDELEAHHYQDHVQ